MNEPLFLDSVLQEKIWGGTKLRDVFGYTLPSEKTGEFWAISAHPNGPSIVNNGPYKGTSLADLWTKAPELFGHAKGDVFPLLTKILDAQDDLSVQVHPDDHYGLAHEGELGKTECWYVIDADEGAEIIYGHHAKTKEELREMIETGKWDDLLRRIKVNKGDFFHVPSGTIHAIGSGIMILETQQSSDTTYRVYDYDRLDDQGNQRDLHITQSVDVTNVPHTDPVLAIETKNQPGAEITTFVSNEYFTVYEWFIRGTATMEAAGPYTLVSVLEGEGTLTIPNGSVYPIKKGTHFILPNDIKDWTFHGELQMIASIQGEG